MTRAGFTALDEELKILKSVERPAVIRAIAEAREHGDLSENAEYHAAKERQGQVEAMIGEIENMVSRAQIIDPTTLSGDKVIFGATVTLLDQPFVSLDAVSIRALQDMLSSQAAASDRAWLIADYETPALIPLAAVHRL